MSDKITILAHVHTVIRWHCGCRFEHLSHTKSDSAEPVFFPCALHVGSMQLREHTFRMLDETDQEFEGSRRTNSALTDFPMDRKSRLKRWLIGVIWKS